MSARSAGLMAVPVPRMWISSCFVAAMVEFCCSVGWFCLLNSRLQFGYRDREVLDWDRRFFYMFHRSLLPAESMAALQSDSDQQLS